MTRFSLIYVNPLSLINFLASLFSQAGKPLSTSLDCLLSEEHLSHFTLMFSFLFEFIDFFSRQKMAEILIHDLHNLAGEAIKTMTHSRSYQIISERQVGEIFRFSELFPFLCYN